MTENTDRAPWRRAVSEFVVIVVGVLVALTFDQWADDRADRSSEKMYLNALATDLATDSLTYADLVIPQGTAALQALSEISASTFSQVGHCRIL